VVISRRIANTAPTAEIAISSSAASPVKYIPKPVRIVTRLAHRVLLAQIFFVVTLAITKLVNDYFLFFLLLLFVSAALLIVSIALGETRAFHALAVFIPVSLGVVDFPLATRTPLDVEPLLADQLRKPNSVIFLPFFAFAIVKWVKE